MKSEFLTEPGRRISLGLGAFFFATTTWSSYARWADFGYRTFDLAYYVQALWQLIHGRFNVSLQYVPLLGNHVEPIVLLLAPLFFVFRHPMLFVAVQNAALAAMGPIGYRICRRLGLTSGASLLLAAALLIAPATGYVALHEFHPEALTAPFLLLMLQARLRGLLRQHWLWFGAALACKENMALLLAAYCLVQCVADRKSGPRFLWRWYLAPLLATLAWFVLCTKVITPAFNAGNIDYGALYDRLGANATEIIRNILTRPQLILGESWHSLTQGNLVPALFLPFLCLPLLRPKWILIALPVFLQHLLSWRSSEWTIYFHYAAPLLPLLWFATAEAAVLIKKLRAFLPVAVLFACIAAQAYLGPADVITATTREWWNSALERTRKNNFIAAIPDGASVLAPLPYLSHLAMREELHSLHYVLKGLRTLSRKKFDPPAPTQFVLIDYTDLATFDRNAGYYHPKMRTVEGQVIGSSDVLLHDFLKRAAWSSKVVDELTLLQQISLPKPADIWKGAQPIAEITPQNQLLAITKSTEIVSSNDLLEIVMTWQLTEPRAIFPWLELQLTPITAGNTTRLVRGLCLPEAKSGMFAERWQIRAEQIPPGSYELSAIFSDHAKSAPLGQPVSLGNLTVTSSR